MNCHQFQSNTTQTINNKTRVWVGLLVELLSRWNGQKQNIFATDFLTEIVPVEYRLKTSDNTGI
jgi:hypothetical protein